MVDPRQLKLVQLNTLPEDQWVGTTVYHPCLQRGTQAFWHTEDFDGIDREIHDEFENEDYLCYDVGEVIETFFLDHEGWPKEDLLRVRFGRDGSSLHYHPSNLWVEV